LWTCAFDRRIKEEVMNCRQALTKYLDDRHLIKDGYTLEAFYDHDWTYISVAGRQVPFLPLFGAKDALVLHDVHHLVTGYDTDFRGEFEVAAWELASGGCADHYVFWPDRIAAALLGLLLAPIRTLRAFWAGRQQQNLYRLDRQVLLGMELDSLKMLVCRTQ
jgi:hypothetical protein